MPRYSEERKAAVLKKLLPPQNRSVVSVAAEEVTSDVTLYSWSKQCREQGMPVPGNPNTREDWSPEAHPMCQRSCPLKCSGDNYADT